jgi:hypothetical protein
MKGTKKPATGKTGGSSKGAPGGKGMPKGKC